MVARITPATGKTAPVIGIQRPARLRLPSRWRRQSSRSDVFGIALRCRVLFNE